MCTLFEEFASLTIVVFLNSCTSLILKSVGTVLNLIARILRRPKGTMNPRETPYMGRVYKGIISKMFSGKINQTQNCSNKRFIPRKRKRKPYLRKLISSP